MQDMHHSLPIGCWLFEAEGDFPKNINCLAKAGVHISRNVLKDHLSTHVPRKPVFQDRNLCITDFQIKDPFPRNEPGHTSCRGEGGNDPHPMKGSFTIDSDNIVINIIGLEKWLELCSLSPGNRSGI